MRNLVLFTGFIGVFAAQAVAQDKAVALKIGSTDFCPFFCESGNPPGYMVEVVKKLFETPATPVTVAYSSWTAAIERTRSGIHMAALAPAHSEAPDFIFPSEALGFQRYCFFKKADSAWTYAGPDSLKAQKIGLVRDISLGELTDWASAPENASRIDFVNMANGTQSNFKKLAAGRVTLVVEDEGVAAFFLKNNAQSAVNAGCLSGELIYLGISPMLGDQGRAIAAKFDSGLNALRASGDLKVILDKYGIADWKK